jgi:hypothetical protein
MRQVLAAACNGASALSGSLCARKVNHAVAAEVKRWAPVVKASGARAD